MSDDFAPSADLPQQDAPVPPTLAGWKAGDRVLAVWPPTPLGWYAGTVRAIEGDELVIDFDDGDKANLRPERVAPLDIDVGCRVLCRWKGGAFFEGTVDQADGDKLHVLYDDGDKEWTTVKYMCVQRGLRARIKEESVPVHSALAPDAVTVGELHAGEEVELGQTWRIDAHDWTEVAFSEGGRGYIPATAKVVHIREVALVQKEAAIHDSPSAAAPVVGQLRRGDVFCVLDQVRHDGREWVKIKEVAGTEGYLDAATAIRELHEPEPAWWRSALAGAYIVLAIGGGFGVLAMVIRGAFLEALAVFVVCVVSGGLAGVVHHWTASWRRSEFGLHPSWMLVMETYLFAAIGCVAVATELLGLGRAEGVLEMLTHPVFAGILAGVGMLFGLFLGYSGQRHRHRAENRPMTFTAWVLPGVGAVGFGFTLTGAIFLWLGLGDWRLAHEASAPPQELRLDDLLRKGFGANRYVHLTGFRFCDAKVPERSSKVRKIALTYDWVPVVPAVKQGEIGEAAPPVPRRIPAVVLMSETFFDDPAFKAIRPRAVREMQRRGWELRGYTGMVANGLQTLRPEVERKLRELAPETKLDDILILDRRVEPVEVGYVEQCVQNGAVALGGGLVVLLLFVQWARRLGEQPEAA